MSNRLPLVDPRLPGSISNFFPQACTIQTYTESRSSTGKVTNAYATYDSMIDIPCRIAPAGGKEVKGTDQIYSMATHKIQLSEYQPTIQTKMRAVVGSSYYDILAVENDAQHLMTELIVEIVVAS